MVHALIIVETDFIWKFLQASAKLARLDVRHVPVHRYVRHANQVILSTKQNVIVKGLYLGIYALLYVLKANLR